MSARQVIYTVSLCIAILSTLCIIAEQAKPEIKQCNIGLLIVATGKYTMFVEPLINSARTNFFPNHTVTFFVFTDGVIPFAKDVRCIYQKRLGWPLDTLMRFDMYYKNKEKLQAMDYLFACDSDALFIDTVGDEILGDRVATLHPAWVWRRGTYETRSISTAYVAPHEGEHYFAGGFYGGKASEFLSMMEVVLEQIKKDFEKNVMAIWHDESHLNRYFIDHKPTKILSPSYCYPESWKLPFEKRILMLDKNHKEFQTKL